jgi:hypothetical protein
MKFCIAAFFVLWIPVAASAQSLPATVVARTGQAVPDVPGATFTIIGTLPRLGANGHVAFNGFIAGGGATGSSDFGYWVGTPGNLRVAAREDSQNGGADQFGGSSIGVDANGTISVWSSLAIPVPANQNQMLQSYLPDGNGGNLVVVREGITPAPRFGDGATFAAIGSGHAANDGGAVAFTGTVLGGDATTASDFGLFTGTPGGLKLVAREGSPAPGASGTSPVFSTTFTPMILDKRINNSGQVGFAAALSGAGVDANNDRSIYVWTPNKGDGTLELAAQTGNLAPDTSPTIRFLTLDDQPGFNDAGQVAFRGQLISDVPGELNLVNNWGIWRGTPGDVEIVVRSGTPSPIAGLTFRSPDASPRTNASGQVAFFTLVQGPGVTLANDRVYWVSTPSGIEIVAREGSPAPGTPAGVNFGTIDPIAVINAPGQVAFTGTLTGMGVVPANDRGLWAGLPGEVSLVAREGDVIDLDPGEGELLKTIASISFANGFSAPLGDSASAAFNDAGQIAWRAQFTDSTTAVLLTELSPITPCLPGDMNDDGIVNRTDAALFSQFFGRETDSECVTGDFDGDGATTLLDWGMLQSHLVPGAPSPQGKVAVPEPSALASIFSMLSIYLSASLLHRYGRSKS